MDAHIRRRYQGKREADRQQRRQTANPPYPAVGLFRSGSRDARQQDGGDRIWDVEDELVHRDGHAVLAERVGVVRHLGLDDIRVGSIVEVTREQRRGAPGAVGKKLGHRRRVATGARTAQPPDRGDHDHGGKKVVDHRTTNRTVDPEPHHQDEDHDQSKQNPCQPQLDQVVDLDGMTAVQDRSAE